MNLVSHQTLGFNTVNSLHVPVADPATEERGGGGRRERQETINLCRYDLIFHDQGRRGGQSPVGPFRLLCSVVKRFSMVIKF